MNILTLQTIINAIEKLSSEGREMLFWWLIADKIIPGIIGVILIIGVLKTINYLIKVMNNDKKDEINRFLSKELKNPQISSELKTFINKFKDFLHE